MITSLSQLDLSKKYTYADYLSWQFEQFVELIKGQIRPMSAPKRVHQKVSGKFFYFIQQGILQQKQNCGCEVYAAPFDVRLVKNAEGKTDKEIYSVVQPDLCVICDLSKLDERGCVGAPDLIIEILSEGSYKRDVQDKFDLYEENGVKEYWIVRPEEKTVQQFYLLGEKYQYKKTYTHNDCITLVVLPNLEIDLQAVFEE